MRPGASVLLDVASIYRIVTGKKRSWPEAIGGERRLLNKRPHAAGDLKAVAIGRVPSTCPAVAAMRKPSPVLLL